MIISVLWLMVMVARLALFALPYANTPNGETFTMVLNVFLIGGLVIVGYTLGRSFLRFASAKADKEGHCQICYAKLDPGAGFCPACGAEILPPVTGKKD